LLEAARIEVAPAEHIVAAHIAAVRIVVEAGVAAARIAAAAGDNIAAVAAGEAVDKPAAAAGMPELAVVPAAEEEPGRSVCNPGTPCKTEELRARIAGRST
jgi:hypothetical protein